MVGGGGGGVALAVIVLYYETEAAAEEEKIQVGESIKLRKCISGFFDGPTSVNF